MSTLPKLARITIVITIFLLILQVVVANRLTTAGLTLNQLGAKEESLNEENELLEKKIASSSSLTAIAQKAEGLGFIKSQLLYLTPSFPVALENSNVSLAR